MDQTVYRLRCGGDPLRRLYHPPLAGLHPEQLEVWQVQWPALKLFLVFLLQSPVFFIVSPAYLEELLTFLVSP